MLSNNLFKIYFLFIFFSSCKTIKKNDSVEVCLLNNSEYKITNILLYDTKYTSLLPNNKNVECNNISRDKILNNSLLQLISKNKNFAFYIDNDIRSDYRLYKIDSLNFKNRFIYFSTSFKKKIKN